MEKIHINNFKSKKKVIIVLLLFIILFYCNNIWHVFSFFFMWSKSECFDWSAIWMCFEIVGDVGFT